MSKENKISLCLENEVWKPIIGYEGLYEVSNKGRIKSFVTFEKILIPQDRKHPNGGIYKKIDLSLNCNVRQLAVHRLEGIAFLPNPLKKRCINHKDRNPSNNNLENLEWATHKENSNHWIADAGRTKIKKEFKKIKSLFLNGKNVRFDWLDIIRKFEKLLVNTICENYGSYANASQITKMEWRDVVGYEGYYIISEFGHVVSLPRIVNRQTQYEKGKTMKVPARLTRQNVNPSLGKFMVHLNKFGVDTYTYPHVLVAKAYLVNNYNFNNVIHEDLNHLNNHYSNLIWCDDSYVQSNSYNNGMRIGAIGGKSVKSKKVKMMDKEGNIIEVFDSIGDIARQYGFCRSSISNVCIGKTKYHNDYKFEFA